MAQPDKNLPYFNQPDEDRMALGFTPSTRSAELVAGARAALLKTDETTALSKLAGRLVSRVISDLDRKNNIMWIFSARMIAIEHLTQRYFPQDQPGLFMVDIAAGFSPRGLHLAQRYPQAEVVEIDLPDVVTEKKRRLEKGKIEIPPNLRWIEADLGKSNLHDVLEGRKANLITNEGLTLYLTPAENERLFHQAASSLLPDGLFIVEIFFRDKFLKIQQDPSVRTAASFVLRMVGNVPGLMENSDAALQALLRADFEAVVEHPVVDMMDELGQPRPYDVNSILVARKPVAAPTAVEADHAVRTDTVGTDAASADHVPLAAEADRAASPGAVEPPAPGIEPTA